MFIVTLPSLYPSRCNKASSSSPQARDHRCHEGRLPGSFTEGTGTSRTGSETSLLPLELVGRRAIIQGESQNLPGYHTGLPSIGCSPVPVEEIVLASYGTPLSDSFAQQHDFLEEHTQIGIHIQNEPPRIHHGNECADGLDQRDRKAEKAGLPAVDPIRSIAQQASDLVRYKYLYCVILYYINLT